MRYHALLLSALCGVANASTCPHDPSTSASTATSLAKSLIFGAVKEKTGNEYSVPSRRANPKEILGQLIQIRAIRKPGLVRFLSRLPCHQEGFDANNPDYLTNKRAAFGENFCTAGQVVLGSYNAVVDSIMNPQARTFKLGTANLDPKHLPGKLKLGPKRSIFLLVLSQKGAGGDGTHEGVRAAFFRYLVNADATNRQSDKIGQALMDQLVEDYETMPRKEFFASKDRGMDDFFIKYVHYCLFGINPHDTKKMKTLYDFYYGNMATLWYFRGIGSIFNILKKFVISRGLRKVIKIYEDSPAIKALPENDPIFASMSRFEFAHAVLPVMAIAAMVGPKHILHAAMGNNKMPVYKEDKVKMDVPAIWKTIDLDDAKEVDAFIHEVGRLWCPVGHTHRVATEEFTVKMLGKDRTFPKGTVVSIPINMSMINKNVWGQNAFHFDHKRENVEKDNMIFHSVGSKHGGRICPGKWFAMNMMREILVKCGKVHQAS